MNKTSVFFWALNTLTDFLLNLYHKRLLQPTNWTIEKVLLEDEFENYLNSSVAKKSSLRKKFHDYCQGIDIVSLLQLVELVSETENNFVIKVKSDSLLTYRAVRLEKFLEQQSILENSMIANYNLSEDMEQPLLKTVQEISVGAPIVPLIYKGRRDQERIKFEQNSTSCIICQRSWNDSHQFQDHVRQHTESTNFIALNLYLNNSEMQLLNVGYHICSNTGNYRFYVAALIPNIVIERIMLILSNFIYYINREQLPCDLITGTPIVFDLHHHMFLQYFQTPIVVVYNFKESAHIQRIEQHHFIQRQKNYWDQRRLSNNYLVNDPEQRFIYFGSLGLYLPDNEVRKAFNKGKQSRLNTFQKLCPGFYDYDQRNKTFTAENYCEALKMLIHFEDLSVLRRYHELLQHDVRLQNLEEGSSSYTWHLMPEYESGILGSRDELLLVPSNESVGNDEPHKTAKEWTMMLSDWKQENSVDSSNNPDTGMCQGLIEKCKNGTIIFKLNQSEMPRRSDTYTMIFRSARYFVRHQMHAIELLQAKHPQILKRFFFPTLRGTQEYSSIVKILVRISLHEVDPLLTNDPEQMLAVKSILNGAGNIAPYIIVGPPGTGKTSTLVKAIYALYKQQAKTKILVMSNSNFICDEIALRLIELLKRPSRKANAILRLYAHSYIHHRDTANKLLLQYSNLEKEHFYPKVETIHEFRIVVCTVNVAGKLTLGGFGHTAGSKPPKPIYTHVIVDEAHSLTEAEIVMGVMCTLENKTKLIIAGDPNQLGTHITSPRSVYYGLDISLMERLLKLDVYEVDEEGDYNRDVMIRLCRNYRSHEQFVNILNKFYYEGRLMAKVDPALVDIGTKWHRLYDSNLPIIFHSVFGQCIQETNTSLFNEEEGLVVLEYLSDLLYYGINGVPIAQKDIGIVTPYREQCKLLKQILYCKKWYGITCGTIETFQGLERQIIMVSFVRTEILPTDILSGEETKKQDKIGLGFLKDPRRMCSLVSRAKSLMILIGDPRVLWESPTLAHIITKCHSSGNLFGRKFELPATEDVDADVNKTEN